MHPGPINRGVEIDSDVADSARSMILKQVTNGLAVRMAALFLISGGQGPPEYRLMPRVQTPDGTEIFYEGERHGAKSILALLHGWGGVGGLWRPVLRHLDGHQFCSLADRLARAWAVRAAGSGGATRGMTLRRMCWRWRGRRGRSNSCRWDSASGGKLALYLTAKKPRVDSGANPGGAGGGQGRFRFTLESRRELARRAADWTQLKAAIKEWFGPTVDEPDD